MNNGELNKYIIHITWIFEAISRQYREAFNSIKLYSTLIQFHHCKQFVRFTQNIRISFMLINQAKSNYHSFIKKGLINKKNILTIYNTYFKRSVFQMQKTIDIIKRMGFDAQFYELGEYKNLKTITFSIDNLYHQLDSVISFLIKNCEI